jgi:hypothetical protein
MHYELNIISQLKSTVEQEIVIARNLFSLVLNLIFVVLFVKNTLFNNILAALQLIAIFITNSKIKSCYISEESK